MRQHSATRRAAFTLSELLVAIAIFGILAAIVLRLKQDFGSIGRYVEVLTISADGSKVIGVYFDKRVEAWRTKDGRRIGSLSSRDAKVDRVVISADGSLVARCCFDTPNPQGVPGFTLEICELQTGNVVRTRKMASPSAITFAPDGQKLAILDTATNQVVLIDVRDENAPETTLGPLFTNVSRQQNQSSATDCIVFSPNGKQLFAFASGLLVKWDFATATPAEAKTSPQQLPPTALLAVSPDGGQVVVMRDNPNDSQNCNVALLETAGFSTVAESVGTTWYDGSAAFADSGKSLAVMAPWSGTIEILDAQKLIKQRQLSLVDTGTTMASSPDGRLLAVAELNRVSVYENGALRQLVGFHGESTGGMMLLFIALFVAIMIFSVMRHRNKKRTCIECGKQWMPTDKSRDPRCPDCRMLWASTEEVRNEQKKAKRQLTRSLAMMAFFLFGLIPLLSVVGGNSIGEALLAGAASVLVILGVIVAVFAIVFAISMLANRWKLHRLRDVDRSLARARRAAKYDGRIEEFGPITLWTDAAEPLAETAESIAAELDDCRTRIEEMTSEACPPVRPLLLLAFSTSAAANRYSPTTWMDADQYQIYLGPHADQGFLSLESIRHITPLSSMVRGVLFYHCVPMRRGLGRFWLNMGFNHFIARVRLPGDADARRRRLIVWNGEGSLLSFEKIFQRRFIYYSTNKSKALLPENEDQSRKLIDQLTSLIDYFCGHDATPQRRPQFQRLWQSLQQTKRFDAACREALGFGQEQLEKDWKAWLSGLQPAEPVAAPPEMVAVAERDVIPLACDTAAAVQKRIKAIRSLGNCGWSIGIEPLRQLVGDSQPDLQREARRALQLLLGGVEIDDAAAVVQNSAR